MVAPNVFSIISVLIPYIQKCVSLQMRYAKKCQIISLPSILRPSCYPSITYNLEVALRIFKNVWAPDQHAMQCKTHQHLAVKPSTTTPVLETDLISWQLILPSHRPRADGLKSHPMNNKLAEGYLDLGRTSTAQVVYSVDDILPEN
jgi:hypothetical protein